jgi:hypothetical protein
METSRDFYYKLEVTLFGFSVYYNDKTFHIEKTISFVSENLYHDTHFLNSAITEMLRKQF